MTGKPFVVVALTAIFVLGISVEARPPTPAPQRPRAQDRGQPGDIVVCFESRDRYDSGFLSRFFLGSSAGPEIDICAQRITRDGRAIWGGVFSGEQRPMVIEHNPGPSRLPTACDDGEGGVIVAWEWENSDHTKDISAQRISKNGELAWDLRVSVAATKASESHPIIVSDGQGGAIIVYEWSDAAGSGDIMAQRIDGAGKLLWNGGQSPVTVAGSPALEKNPCVISDGQGGAFVFFESVGKDDDIDIMGQHLSADGRLWADGKKAIEIASTDSIERHPVAVLDGAGGAIVAFESEARSGKYKGDTDIMAQRISRDGKLQWGSANKPAIVTEAVGLDRNPVAVTDGAGGVIVAYEFEPTEGDNAGDIDIRAQRLDFHGHRVWNGGKSSNPVCNSMRLERAPAIASDGKGGAIVVAEAEIRTGDNAGDIDLFGQRISGAGALLWNGGKKSVYVAESEWHERNPTVVPDGEGGAIVVYSAIAVGGKLDGDIDLESMRIDSNGKLIWNNGEESVHVSATDKLERNPCVVVIGAR